MKGNTEDFVIQRDSKPPFLVEGRGSMPCTLAPWAAV